MSDLEALCKDQVPFCVINRTNPLGRIALSVREPGTQEEKCIMIPSSARPFRITDFASFDALRASPTFRKFIASNVLEIATDVPQSEVRGQDDMRPTSAAAASHTDVATKIEKNVVQTEPEDKDMSQGLTNPAPGVNERFQQVIFSLTGGEVKDKDSKQQLLDLGDSLQISELRWGLTMVDKEKYPEFYGALRSMLKNAKKRQGITT